LKRIYLPLLALVIGLLLAFLAAGVSSYFFVLLPISAFAFGYFSSWRLGLLCGSLLFAGYTLMISVVWFGFNNPNLLYPTPYIGAFIMGGFGVLLTGALASQLRKGLKRVGSIMALVVLAIIIGWCGYMAIPHYSYYYQVAVQSSENISNLELYLPIGTVSGEPYIKLYDQALDISGDYSGNFTREIVITEQEKMLKITIPELEKDDVPVPRYTANIIFWYGRSFWQKIPFELIQLSPKSEVKKVGTVTSQRFLGPIKSRETRIIETFNVPVMAVGNKRAQVNLSIWNRTDRSEWLNFTYSKEYPYTERIDFTIQTDGGWEMVPVEVTTNMEIGGITD
jgi:hypothetical protein